jgi:hypothetical protein
VKLSPGDIQKSNKKKMHVFGMEQLTKIFFMWKIVHPILLTKTDCASTSLQKVNLMLYQVPTVNCDAVDWMIYLQTSVWALRWWLAGFYKRFCRSCLEHTGKTLKPAVPSWDFPQSSFFQLLEKIYVINKHLQYAKGMLSLARKCSRNNGTKIMYIKCLMHAYRYTSSM